MNGSQFQHIHQKIKHHWRWQYSLVGILSLLWVVIRTGQKPSRISYPCQQAALATGASFLTYAASVIGIGVIFHKIWVKRLYVGGGLASILVILGTFSTSQPAINLAAPDLSLPAWEHTANHQSDVFVIKDIPAPTVSLDGGVKPGGLNNEQAFHDFGIDSLVYNMETNGAYFYKTASHPTGIIGSNDVVVLKINGQWNGSAETARNSTNNDLVKGLIWQILKHPNGFTGAVVIADNTQNFISHWSDSDYNNAQDPGQSYADIVSAFNASGYKVCISDWSNGAGFGDFIVNDFNQADSRSGYVLLDDPEGPGKGRLSYPKFSQSCNGQNISVSLKKGVWNGSSFDNSRLKLINLPVLKVHCMAGATISVKNYIGLLTIADTINRFGDWDEMHGYFWGYLGAHPSYGLLGKEIALVRPANLNIVDSIWANTNNNWKGCDAGSCIRSNVILASKDPIAADYYASTYMLYPITNAGDITPEITPADTIAAPLAGEPHQLFRDFLITNENAMRAQGMTSVINLDKTFTQAQEEAQFNVFVAASEIVINRPYRAFLTIIRK